MMTSAHITTTRRLVLSNLVLSSQSPCALAGSAPARCRLRHALTAWLVAWLVSVPLVAQVPCFKPEVSIASSVGCESMVTTDLDGDGLPDLLMSAGSFKTAWARNLGDGAFGLPTTISNATGRAVGSSDLDGDGDADVISSSHGTTDVIENLGGGTFGLRLSVAAGITFTQGIAVADLDGDGDRDLLIQASDRWNEVRSEVFWVPNLGSMSFGPKQVLHQSTPGGGAVQARDLDGDGDQDIVAMTAEGLLLFEGQGSGTFGAPVTIDATHGTDVKCVDVDGDGDEDVVAANTNGVIWFKNLSAGAAVTLGAGQSIPTLSLVYALDLADMDGDGDVDLATNGGDRVVLYLNLGGGTFDGGNLLSSTSQNSRRVHLADVDQDGHEDVLYAAWNAGKVALLRSLIADLAINPIQPMGVSIDISSCFPDHDYVTAFTFDGANAGAGFRTGWWGGLHISVNELLSALNSPFAPFRGTLDSSGNAVTQIVADVSSVSGVTIYANVTLFDPTGGYLVVQSQPIAYTF